MNNENAKLKTAPVGMIEPVVGSPRMLIFWKEASGEILPVNKVECCTDGEVRLVWVEKDCTSHLRDTWDAKGELILEIRRTSNAQADRPDGAGVEWFL